MHSGGVSRIYGNQILSFTAADGLFDGYVKSLMEDVDGLLWAGGLGGLARYRDAKWQRVGDEVGFPKGQVYCLYRDRLNSLWVSSSTGIYRRQYGSERFVTVSRDRTFVESLTEDNRGNIWAADSRSVAKIYDGANASDV